MILTHIYFFYLLFLFFNNYIIKLTKFTFESMIGVLNFHCSSENNIFIFLQ